MKIMYDLKKINTKTTTFLYICCVLTHQAAKHHMVVCSLPLPPLPPIPLDVLAKTRTRSELIFVRDFCFWEYKYYVSAIILECE